MGGCFSDVRGGTQAVGGTALMPTSPIASGNNASGHNDAIEFFFRSRGLQALVSQIELSLTATNLLDCDIASKNLKLHDQDFIGEASCVLSEVVSRSNQTLTLRLQNITGHDSLKNIGTLTVHAEEKVASKSAIEISFRILS